METCLFQSRGNKKAIMKYLRILIMVSQMLITLALCKNNCDFMKLLSKMT